MLLTIFQLMPGAAILICLADLFMQSSGNPLGQVTIVLSGGSFALCMTVVWKASQFQTTMLTEVKQLKIAAEELITKDKLERRLLEERIKSNESYVQKDECSETHNKLNGRVNGMAKGHGA